MKILVLNGGSSSFKASLYDVAGELPPRPAQPLWSARGEWGRNEGKAELAVRTAAGMRIERQVDIDSPRAIIKPMLETLWEEPAKVVGSREEIDAAGHRVVNGGKFFREPTRVTAEVKAKIVELGEFAPEHNPLEAAAIDAVEQVLGPDLPQLAVFDTAFHVTLPREAIVYPGPYNWFETGIIRYGFHGISHEYTSRRAAEVVGGSSHRMITCHLGNGCSLAAVRDGRSVDTTMGFTPMEGLMMGSRPGSIDPGIIIYLVRDCGYDAARLDQILNRESGLKGLSGVSGDMREVLAAIEAGNERAKLAFDVFVHRLVREIGGMMASLGGLDVLVFTAGIGENSAPVREAVCRRLGFAGVKLDEAKNAGSPRDEDIAAPDSAVRVAVIHTEEDWEIVRECCKLMC